MSTATATATAPPNRALRRPTQAGEGDYREALDERTQQLIGLLHAPLPAAPTDPQQLLALSAQLIAERGMPIRHAAARQAAAGYAAVYLRHHSLTRTGAALAVEAAGTLPPALDTSSGRLSDPPPLIWLVPSVLLRPVAELPGLPEELWADGACVLADLARCVGADTPLRSAVADERATALLEQIAADPVLTALPLAGVRLCALGAPRSSMLLDPHGQHVPLVGTRLWAAGVAPLHAVSSPRRAAAATPMTPSVAGGPVPETVLRAATARADRQAARAAAARPASTSVPADTVSEVVA